MMRWKRCTNHSGFTLIEVLVALFCMSIALLLVVECVRIMSHLSKHSYHSEDRIAIDQMRLLLVQSDHITTSQDALHFSYHKEPTYIELHNHRLVKRDGYEILMKDLDDVRFVKKGACFYVVWTRKEKTKQAAIVCE